MIQKGCDLPAIKGHAFSRYLQARFPACHDWLLLHLCVCFWFQLSFDSTDLRVCLGSEFNVTPDSVNSTHLEWAGIVYGQEYNDCAVDGPTCHFPEVILILI